VVWFQEHSTIRFQSDALNFFEAFFLPRSFGRSFPSGSDDLLPLSFGFLLGHSGFQPHVPAIQVPLPAGTDLADDISTSVKGFSKCFVKANPSCVIEKAEVKG
jgi:hypothetical protein